MISEVEKNKSLMRILNDQQPSVSTHRSKHHEHAGDVSHRYRADSNKGIVNSARDRQPYLQTLEDKQAMHINNELSRRSSLPPEEMQGIPNNGLGQISNDHNQDLKHIKDLTNPLRQDGQNLINFDDFELPKQQKVGSNNIVV